mmetsp:Transcript_13716/g.36453  ORF Transcript_13716/g.36453 Transcript_13716/m.36453 type:complete len:200 (-) Transcript_13716:6-605(-)
MSRCGSAAAHAQGVWARRAQPYRGVARPGRGLSPEFDQAVSASGDQDVTLQRDCAHVQDGVAVVRVRPRRLRRGRRPRGRSPAAPAGGLSVRGCQLLLHHEDVAQMVGSVRRALPGPVELAHGVVGRDDKGLGRVVLRVQAPMPHLAVGAPGQQEGLCAPRQPERAHRTDGPARAAGGGAREEGVRRGRRGRGEAGLRL